MKRRLNPADRLIHEIVTQYLTPPLSETQRKALDNMESIWLKFAANEPSLKETVDIVDVQTACQIVSSHHIRPAHQTIALIESGDIPLVTEFFDALSKLPGLEDLQDRRARIEQVKAAWLEHLQPPKVVRTDQDIMQLVDRYWSIISEA